jgi:2-iminobutanoate/2-iminopropanoate deaminase
MQADELLAKYAKGERQFSYAQLRGVGLKGADLSGIDLQSADLTGADLSEAILTKANVHGTNFSRASLQVQI